MTGKQLTSFLGASIARRTGKRKAVKVAAPYRAWARRHQSLLRDAFQYPNTEIDLTSDLSQDDVHALGLIKMENGRFTHPLGDDELLRTMLTPRDEAVAIGASPKRRLQQEQHGLERQVA
jgi:hypothetical protein